MTHTANVRTASARQARAHPTQSFVALAHLSRAAAEHGVAVPALEAAAGDRPRCADVGRAWAHAVALLDDRALPMRVARVPLHGMLSPVSLMCFTAGTLDRAIDVFIRHSDAVSEALAITRENRSGDHVIATETLAQDAGVSLDLEFHVADQVQTARELVGADLCPKVIRFAHAGPSHAAHLESLVGCDVEFGARRTEIVIDPRDLERVVTRPLPSLVEAMCRQVIDRERTRLRAGASTAARAQRSIEDRLASDSRPSLAAVARDLAVSRRTLHRLLADEGTSYRELLDRARRARAELLLATTDASLEVIAEQVGLSGTRALRRAFARWTSTTPGAFRAAITDRWR